MLARRRVQVLIGVVTANESVLHSISLHVRVPISERTVPVDVYPVIESDCAYVTGRSLTQVTESETVPVFERALAESQAR